MFKAWGIIKAGRLESKVTGISLPNRQRATARLTRYTGQYQNHVTEGLYKSVRQKAVAVMASVNGSKSYQMGYLPHGLSMYVAPFMDAGRAVQGAFKAIKGKYASWMNYGMKIEVVI